MKKISVTVFFLCAVSVMLFTGCENIDENLTYQIQLYFEGLMSNDSGMKNIDSAHKEAFDSVFNDIEVFGAKLCIPMNVSELPDKFELSNSLDGYVPLSEEEPRVKELGGGLKRYSLMLYYDKEIRVAGVSVICRGDQSVEEGIIYELNLGVTYFQPILLAGKLKSRSDMDIDDVRELLGEGNEFYDSSSYSKNEFCEVFYTDGNRIIELIYTIQEDDFHFLYGYIRTYNDYGSF